MKEPGWIPLKKFVYEIKKKSKLCIWNFFPRIPFWNLVWFFVWFQKCSIYVRETYILFSASKNMWWTDGEQTFKLFQFIFKLIESYIYSYILYWCESANIIITVIPLLLHANLMWSYTYLLSVFTIFGHKILCITSLMMKYRLFQFCTFILGKMGFKYNFAGQVVHLCQYALVLNIYFHVFSMNSIFYNIVSSLKFL